MEPKESPTTAGQSGGLIRHIADTIREEIIHGRLAVGSRLPSEPDLAKRFNASGPTVREAMKVLTIQNLVQSRRGPNGGIFVSRPTLDSANNLLSSITTWLVTLGVFALEDVAEARRFLGRACTGLATQRRGEKDLQILERELRRMSDAAGSNEQFCDAELRFNRAIATAAGNRVLQLIMLIVNESLVSATRMIVFKFQQREMIVELCSRVLSSIRSRRPEAGEIAYAALMDYLIECHEQATREAAHGRTTGYAEMTG